MIVHVEEVFLHFDKCIIRSDLWANVDHGKLDKSYQEMDEIIKNDEETRLY